MAGKETKTSTRLAETARQSPGRVLAKSTGGAPQSSPFCFWICGRVPTRTSCVSVPLSPGSPRQLTGTSAQKYGVSFVRDPTITEKHLGTKGKARRAIKKQQEAASMDILSPQTSQILLEEELEDRIEYDNPNILHAIYKVDQIPDALVDTCVQGLLADPLVAGHLNRLRVLAARADDDERSMYPLLAAIFSTIMMHGAHHAAALPAWDGSTVHRYPEICADRTLQDDSDMAIPGRKPDFAFFDGNGPTQYWWRLASAFGEVKPKAMPEGPDSQLVGQVADVSRIHLATRPFQLFSLTLCICGTTFYVSSWDRAGGVFSPAYDYCDNGPGFGMLVRVIMQITMGLSAVEVGHDPNVSLADPLGPDERPPPTLKSLTSKLEKAYPSFNVEFHGAIWRTFGFPLFQSISYIGRGTSVWRVWNSARGARILKSAWRSETRRPEIVIYEGLREKLHEQDLPWPIGVAQVEGGGDVMRLDDGSMPLHISDLRGGLHRNIPNDPILHRVLLKSIGIPLWRYESVDQLLGGFRDAIKGHQAMYSCGLLHRDVSIGNVMLSANPEEDQCIGFMTDVDFSKEFLTRPVTPEPGTSAGAGFVFGPANSSAEPGAAMSGTAQFMGIEVLTHYKDMEEDDPILIQDQHHDLESFVWVLIYAILKHELLEEGRKPYVDAADLKALGAQRARFRDYFGQRTLALIWEKRLVMMIDKNAMKDVPAGPLHRLVQDLLTAVARANPGFRTGIVARQITHTFFIEQLEATLRELSTTSGSETE